ncbi:MAG: sulfite oxidase [Bacteroidota bacterium]
MAKTASPLSSGPPQVPRRTFLGRTSIVVLGSLLGSKVVFAKYLPPGLALLGLDGDQAGLPGKHPELTVLNDRPVNAETPAHLLDDQLTPADKLFVRNNGIPPPQKDIDPATWTLNISGEGVSKTISFTLPELQAQFEHHSYQLTLECGGNGRKEFNPPAKGNQWSTGAIGCPKWTGVRLRDVLAAAGLQSKAVYVGYYGRDTHLSGDPGKVVISRGVPIAKAMEEQSLIAWAMNGKPLPWLNGYPLRLVFGGYPASCSGKWLSKIVVRDRVHDGPKMGGQSYRVPCKPVAPGTKVPDEEMCIIEEMPIKSLITFPKTGATIRLDQELPIRGHAWVGQGAVHKVSYSIDFGASWQECSLEDAANPYAWQHFSARIRFPEKGYYEVWAKATDTNGIAQPMLLPGWNPRGYLNNACHRIAIRIA